MLWERCSVLRHSASSAGMFYPATESVGSIVVSGIVGAIILGVVGFFGAYVLCDAGRSGGDDGGCRRQASTAAIQTTLKAIVMDRFGAAAIMFLIPAVLAGTISFVVNVSAKAFDPQPKDRDSEAVSSRSAEGIRPAPVDPKRKRSLSGIGALAEAAQPLQTARKWICGLGQTNRSRVAYPDLWLPMQIFVLSFSAIIVALLYFKTRLAGGESMNELIERFEDDGRPRKKWQERVRAEADTVGPHSEQTLTSCSARQLKLFL